MPFHYHQRGQTKHDQENQHMSEQTSCELWICGDLLYLNSVDISLKYCVSSDVGLPGGPCDLTRHLFCVMHSVLCSIFLNSIAVILIIY